MPMLSLLFAPTALAAANLRDEQVGGAMFITGNTGIDAVLRASAELPPPTLRERGLPRLLVTCHRREIWATGLRSVTVGAAPVGGQRHRRIDVLLHPNPHVSDMLERLLGSCAGSDADRALRPCGAARPDARLRPDAERFRRRSGGSAGDGRAAAGTARQDRAARGAVERQHAAGRYRHAGHIATLLQRSSPIRSSSRRWPNRACPMATDCRVTGSPGSSSNGWPRQPGRGFARGIRADCSGSPKWTSFSTG